MGNNKLLAELRNGKNLTFREQLLMILQLSIPGILAQISEIIMEYIDASMVGSLGAGASASIGLIASTTWLMGGLGNAVGTGFSVQIAQYIGAGNERKAREIFRQGILAALVIGLLVGGIGAAVHNGLPVWLGGDAAITGDAARYFLVFSMTMPVQALLTLANGALQCTGNMVVPSVLYVMVCVLDVVFNCFCIFPARPAGELFHAGAAVSGAGNGVAPAGNLSGQGIHAVSVLASAGRVKTAAAPAPGTGTAGGFMIPGLGLGVMGASLGTSLSEITVLIIGFIYIWTKGGVLKPHAGEKFRIVPHDLKVAAKIAVPVAFESTVMCAAQIMQTRIVSPLGTVAIAANSLAVTAESLCYMPGYGIQSAATTIVGQSIGAGRKDLVRRFGWMTTLFGMVLMAGSGALMYALAPVMIGILSPDPGVRELGAAVLRIEAFAEPMFGASIVASGVFRGAGDTLAPSVMSLVSMWAVRIPIAAILAPRIGLKGVWLGMCIELNFRGAVFVIRLAGHRWSDKIVTE